MADVLTAEEERVLSMVREMVAEGRARDGAAEIGELKKTIARAGAVVANETCESGTFILRGARFMVRALSDPQGAIELRFLGPEV